MSYAGNVYRETISCLFTTGGTDKFRNRDFETMPLRARWEENQYDYIDMHGRQQTSKSRAFILPADAKKLLDKDNPPEEIYLRRRGTAAKDNNETFLVRRIDRVQGTYSSREIVTMWL